MPTNTINDTGNENGLITIMVYTQITVTATENVQTAIMVHIHVNVTVTVYANGDTIVSVGV